MKLKIINYISIIILLLQVFSPIIYATDNNINQNIQKQNINITSENKKNENEIEKQQEIEQNKEQEKQQEIEQNKEQEKQQEIEQNKEQEKQQDIEQNKEQEEQTKKEENEIQKQENNTEEDKHELKENRNEQNEDKQNETKEEKQEKEQNQKQKNNQDSDNIEENNENIKKINNNNLLKINQATIEEGTYIIQTAIKSNIIFEIENYSMQNEAKLQLKNKSTQFMINQKFIIKNAGDGYYTIKIKHSGKVLDVAAAGKTNGTKVQQYTKNGTDAQKWLLQKTPDGYYNIISKCNGLCLDVPAAIAKNGTNMQVYQSNGTNAQKFQLIKINDVVPKQTIPNGTYKIKANVKQSIGIEVDNSADTNGANIKLETQSNISKKNQQFEITYKGNGYYEIIAKHSKKSLDVTAAGMTNGTNIQQYMKNNTNSQMWIIKDNNDGTYSIISKLNDLYLDIYAGNIKKGNNIQVYEGNGTNAQKFKLEKVEKPKCKELVKSGIYKIETALNNKKVLDISGGSNKNGANVQIWDSDTVLQQRFELIYNKEGYYEIKCSHSGKLLNLAYGRTKNGTNVEQYIKNGAEAEKWILQDAGNGYFYIMSKSAELYLDVAAAGTANGTNVQIYEGNETNAQKFKFAEADILKGIDVSEHQKLIDWRTAKQSGNVDFAIIRCGFGGDTQTQDDKFFERNVLECERLGIPYGVYLYSYAGTREGAKSEAEHVLRLLKGKNPTFGIWIDMEDTDGYKSRNGIAHEKGVEVCDEFCKVIQKAGYNNVGIYASLSWLNGCLNDSMLDKYQKWIAQWNDTCDYQKPYVMWQYTSSGKVSGIIGKVDMDLALWGTGTNGAKGL